MKYFLNNLSFPMLLIMAVLLGTAPLGGEPHLIEKINMLMAGQLVKPLDIFDLILHASPFILLLVKSFFWFQDKNNTEKSEP